LGQPPPWIHTAAAGCGRPALDPHCHGERGTRAPVEMEREENGRAGGEHSAPCRPFLCSASEANREAQSPGSTLPPPRERGARRYGARPPASGRASGGRSTLDPCRERGGRVREMLRHYLVKEREGESAGGRREGAAMLCRSERERVRESVCEKVNGKPNSRIYMKKDIGPRLGLLGLNLFRGGHYSAPASEN
jgi:hypothetical protein